MARVTIEDCLMFKDNQFDLVLQAARRARQLAKGGTALVSEDGDKPTVIALREIGSGRLPVDYTMLSWMHQPDDDSGISGVE